MSIMDRVYEDLSATDRGAGPDAPWVLERAPGWAPRDDLAREAGLVVQVGRA